MGAEVTVGALLGAAAISAVGSVAGSAISSSQASATNEETMDFNREEAEKARAWQEKMYGQQLADQRQNYESMQSPAAIAKYLKQIGVNPAKVFGGSSSGFGSLGSVPSFPSAEQASVAGLQNPGASWQNTFGQVGSSAVDVVNSIADKNLKDSQAIKLLAEKANLEAQTRILQWQDMINNTVGNEKARAELNNIVAQTVMYETAGEYNKAQTLVAQTIQKLNNKQFEINDETLAQLKTRGLFLVQSLKNEQELQRVQIGVGRSEMSRNYAYANEAKENALTVKEIRPAVKKYHEALANLTDTKDFVTSNTAWNEVQQSLYDLEAKKLLPEEIREAINHARKRNDWYEVNEILGIVDEGVKAYGTYYGAKTGKGFVDAQNVRNDIQREFNEYQRTHQKKKVYNVDTGDVYYQ